MTTGFRVQITYPEASREYHILYRTYFQLIWQAMILSKVSKGLKGIRSLSSQDPGLYIGYNHQKAKHHNPKGLHVSLSPRVISKTEVAVSEGKLGGELTKLTGTYYKSNF